MITHWHISQETLSNMSNQLLNVIHVIPLLGLYLAIHKRHISFLRLSIVLENSSVVPFAFHVVLHFNSKNFSKSIAVIEEDWHLVAEQK